MNTPSDNTKAPAQPRTSSLNAKESVPQTVEAAPARLPRLLPLGLAALVVIGLAAVAGYLPRLRLQEELAKDQRAQAIPNVLVVKPVPGKAPGGTPLPAEIRPLVEAPIYARASGYVKRWLVDIGANVEAGQLLAEIDTPELDQDLARSRAEVSQAEAALSLAKTTAARWAELAKTASVSEQESAEKQADLALKLATTEAARAGLRRLEEMKSFAKVTAPFGGTVTARLTDIGQLVNAGSGKELFRLAQMRTLRVFVRVPQALGRAVAVGQSAQLALTELPGRKFTGKVVRTAGAIDAASRTLLVEIEVNNERGEILSGSYALVQLTEAKPEAALTIPANTLLFRAEGAQVGVVPADGKVQLRTVRLGRDFGASVEILEGLSLNDLVILNPSDSLTAGTVVQVGGSGVPEEKGKVKP